MQLSYSIAIMGTACPSRKPEHFHDPWATSFCSESHVGDDVIYQFEPQSLHAHVFRQPPFKECTVNLLISIAQRSSQIEEKGIHTM